MKDYKKIICLTAAVCLLGAAAFCGYHIYDHYAHEAEQTEAFENIAAIVEQAQTEDNDAPEVPLTEEENVLAEYGELFLKNTDISTIMLFVPWTILPLRTFDWALESPVAEIMISCYAAFMIFSGIFTIVSYAKAKVQNNLMKVDLVVNSLYAIFGVCAFIMMAVTKFS